MKLQTISSKFLNSKISYALIILMGIFIKIILLPVEKADYVTFLSPWMDFIKSHGFEHSLKYNFYDYTPSYIYFLVLIAKIGCNPLYSVKFISFFFEYLAGFFVGKIAYLKYKSNLVILASIAIVPVLPSVMLNASYLSQCDSIYTAFVLGSIYYLLKNKYLISILFLGLAFAFKMQTAFILPLFFILMLRKEIKWYYFTIIPLVYLISLIPAWYYGRSYFDLMSIYLSQSGKYKFLTLNFPNIYIFFNNTYYELIKNIGLIITVILTLLIGFIFKSKKYIFDLETIIRFAFLSSIIIPFILPGMHERYMFLGDILGVLYFLIIRKNILLPLGILSVSLYSYSRCSRFNEYMPMSPAFAVYFIVIIFACYDLITSLKKPRNESN